MSSCTLCGATALGGHRLPSHQPLCPHCASCWRDVQVHVVAGRSTTAHLNDWCIEIEAAVAAKNRGAYHSGEIEADDVVSEKSLGMVPWYRVCRVCASRPPARVERAAP